MGGVLLVTYLWFLYVHSRNIHQTWSRRHLHDLPSQSWVWCVCVSQRGVQTRTCKLQRPHLQHQIHRGERRQEVYAWAEMKVKDQEQLANPLQAMVVVHELYEVPLYLGWHEIKGVSSNTVYNQQIAATLTECPLTQAFHQLVLYTWHKQVPFLSIYPQSCQEALFVPRPCWPEWYPATLTTGSVISRSPMISVNPSLISSGVLASFRYSSIMRLLADEAWNREEGWTIRFPSEAVLFFYRNFFWAHRQEGRLHDLSSATDHVYL